jgi:hypothetical protein
MILTLGLIYAIITTNGVSARQSRTVNYYEEAFDGIVESAQKGNEHESSRNVTRTQ